MNNFFNSLLSIALLLGSFPAKSNADTGLYSKSKMQILSKVNLLPKQKNRYREFESKYKIFYSA